MGHVCAATCWLRIKPGFVATQRHRLKPNWMEANKIKGTIKIWPGVAEEDVGTKAYYVRAGLFKDVDIVLFTHVASNMAVSWGDGGQNGLVSVEYQFKGESAHAAANPWRGRSALDAVELMDVGWNFRREHLRLAQRSHSVIRDGGDQPNVVPSNATTWYYLRELDYDHIKSLWAVADSVAAGAALMTGTTLLPTRIVGSAWPRRRRPAPTCASWLSAVRARSA